MAYLLAAGELGHSCKLCRNENTRLALGCDQEAPGPVFQVPCPSCWGDCCELCGNSGLLEFSRCAPKTVTMESTNALRAYGWFVEHGILPNAGGWLDQPSTLVQAVEHLRAVAGLVQDEKDEEARKEAERANRR